MNRLGCVLSHFKSFHKLACRSSLLPKNGRFFSSLGDALIDPKEGSISANVEIVNYSLAGLYIVAYNDQGFVLSNNTVIYGPMVSFPQSSLSWNASFNINNYRLCVGSIMQRH